MQGKIRICNRDRMQKKLFVIVLVFNSENIFMYKNKVLPEPHGPCCCIDPRFYSP